jgi:hypothetical protein
MSFSRPHGTSFSIFREVCFHVAVFAWGRNQRASFRNIVVFQAESLENAEWLSLKSVVEAPLSNVFQSQIFFQVGGSFFPETCPCPSFLERPLLTFASALYADIKNRD